MPVKYLVNGHNCGILSGNESCNLWVKSLVPYPLCYSPVHMLALRVYCLCQDVEPVMMGHRMQHQLNLEKGNIYQVRVRVGVDNGYKGEWSLWSPATSWRSEVGREPQSTGGKVMP